MTAVPRPDEPRPARIATPAQFDDWVRLFANRDDMADEYASLLTHYGRPEWEGWRPLNEAILRRWSPSGLRYIKTKAWRAAA